MNDVIFRHIVAGAVAAAAFAGCTGTPDGTLIHVGDDVPCFRVRLSDGTEMTSECLTAYGGIVLFFNTGCGDCHRELPLWQRYYEDTRCNIVCVSREESAASVGEYWRTEGLTMPWSAQTDRSVYNLFALSGIPRAYVIAPGGKITATYGSPPNPFRDNR